MGMRPPHLEGASGCAIRRRVAARTASNSGRSVTTRLPLDLVHPARGDTGRGRRRATTARRRSGLEDRPARDRPGRCPRHPRDRRRPPGWSRPACRALHAGWSGRASRRPGTPRVPMTARSSCPWSQSSAAMKPGRMNRRARPAAMAVTRQPGADAPPGNLSRPAPGAVRTSQEPARVARRLPTPMSTTAQDRRVHRLHHGPHPSSRVVRGDKTRDGRADRRIPPDHPAPDAPPRWSGPLRGRRPRCTSRPRALRWSGPRPRRRRPAFRCRRRSSRRRPRRPR